MRPDEHDTISRYHGGMSGAKKTEELERFKNGKADIMLGLFKTLGLGLNVTCANYMIFAEPPFTHADWIQAICRMYRQVFRIALSNRY